MSIQENNETKLLATRLKKHLTVVNINFLEGFQTIHNKARTGDVNVFNALGSPLFEQRLGIRFEPLCRAKSALERSEEHTSELQSRGQLVCRLLLEKKDNASR